VKKGGLKRGLIVSVASGKGGTGKTTVAVNLAVSIKNVQIIDCDVEEPNDHILLKPEIIEEKPVYSLKPKILEDLCDHCGLCAKLCQYNAIFVTPNKVLTFPELCHSCGLCSLACPKGAIREERIQIGVVRRGLAGNIEVAYGELTVGEPMAEPIIREVKRWIKPDRTVIVDSPPGASCSAVASVYGSDFGILVTEPTPFGLHDLKIAVEVLRGLNIPLGVVVNKAGIGDRNVYKFCEEEGIPIMLEIPFSRRIAELYSKGIPFALKMEGWKEKFRDLIRDVEEILKG